MHRKANFMSADFNSKATSQAKKKPAKKERAGALGDMRSETLLTDAKALGNAEMLLQIKASKQNRDALLKHIVGRLSTMRQLQLKETDLLKKRDEWFIEVHLGNERLPDPRRWAPAAREYKAAALALCRGDIQRGIALLKDAQAAEAEARKTLPQTMGPVDKSPAQIPVDTGGQREAAPCDPPKGLIIADRILSLSPSVADASSRKKALHDWFGPEEEEEDEDADDAS
jgi:hypothetical protein